MNTRTIGKTIQRSWMDYNGVRLDSQPYLSGAFETRVLLARLKAEKQPLRTVLQPNGIIHAGREGRTYVSDPEYGVPFLGSTDILAADLSWLPLLSKKQVDANPLFTIQEGWTLITRSGTVGRMAYVRPDMAGMACSEHVLRVVADPDKILPGYLYAYLSSRFGVPLVVSGTYGAIIQHIEPQHIADLPVPRLAAAVEQEIHDLIAQAAHLRSEYQQQVTIATDMLFDAVGLKDIQATTWHEAGPDLGFSQPFASPFSLRAVNFNPRFQNLCASIQSRSYRQLGEVCKPGTLHRGGRYKRIDAEPGHGYQLIGQKQLFWQRPEGRWVAGFAMGEDVFVEPGTILIAAQGTLGESELYCRSEFIWGAGVSLAYSEHLLRVVPNEEVMLQGCLFAFLRSETAFRMLRSISVGSKLQDHHYAFLPKLPVPCPSWEMQEKIHRLVVDAYEKRHLSNDLETQAVNLIEKMIQEDS